MVELAAGDDPDELEALLEAAGFARAQGGQVPVAEAVATRSSGYRPASERRHRGSNQPEEDRSVFTQADIPWRTPHAPDDVRAARKEAFGRSLGLKKRAYPRNATTLGGFITSIREPAAREVVKGVIMPGGPWQFPHWFDHVGWWYRGGRCYAIVFHPYQVGDDGVDALNRLQAAGVGVEVSVEGWYGHGTSRITLLAPVVADWPRVTLPDGQAVVPPEPKFRATPFLHRWLANPEAARRELVLAS